MMSRYSAESSTTTMVKGMGLLLARRDGRDQDATRVPRPTINQDAALHALRASMPYVLPAFSAEMGKFHLATHEVIPLRTWATPTTRCHSTSDGGGSYPL